MLVFPFTAPTCERRPPQADAAQDARRRHVKGEHPELTLHLARRELRHARRPLPRRALPHRLRLHLRLHGARRHPPAVRHQGRRPRRLLHGVLLHAVHAAAASPRARRRGGAAVGRHAAGALPLSLARSACLAASSRRPSTASRSSTASLTFSPSHRRTRPSLRSARPPLRSSLARSLVLSSPRSSSSVHTPSPAYFITGVLLVPVVRRRAQPSKGPHETRRELPLSLALPGASRRLVYHTTGSSSSHTRASVSDAL
mgnify:CR=1 FL=1